MNGTITVTTLDETSMRLNLLQVDANEVLRHNFYPNLLKLAGKTGNAIDIGYDIICAFGEFQKWAGNIPAHASLSSQANERFPRFIRCMFANPDETNGVLLCVAIILEEMLRK